MIYTVKHVLLIGIMAVFCSCGSRTSKSSKNVPGTKYRRYATEELAIALDISMRPDAVYDDDTPFYNQRRKFYNLSDNEIETIKTILSDKQKWQKLGSKFPFLNISVYYRQYLAYRKLGHIYVLVNLYKYYYMVFLGNDVLGAGAPPKGIAIISLANDKSRNKYDNVTILLDLSQKRILEVHDIQEGCVGSVLRQGGEDGFVLTGIYVAHHRALLRLQGLTFHETEDYTIYPAPILSVTHQRFTKHYFIGDRRVASKIGAGIFQNAYGHGANVVTAGQKDYQMRMMQIEKQREDYYRKLGTPPGVPTMKGATAEPENTHEGYNTIIKELGDHSVPDGWIQRPKRNAVPDTPPGPPVQWDKAEDPDDVQPGYGYVPADTTHEDIFFYHTDHLGSTSYITDAKANVAQFDAYLPYGELLVDEHSSSEEMPYKFNGKEFDEETGLYYYGARYMNPKTSLWYGVDPVAEKYPSVGAYVYCVDNPIKLIDPNGKDWYHDKDGTMQYSPTVHSAKDLGNGQRYVGATFHDKKNAINYRKDGSILFKNETAAYNRMQYQADKHYRTKKEPYGREVGVFILKGGSVLVLPEYKNDLRSSNISDYGYIIRKKGTVKHGKETFHVLAQIHTHQQGTSIPSVEVYVGEGGDDRFSAQMGARPVFTIGMDGKIHGIISTETKYSFFEIPSPYNSKIKILRGGVKLSQYLRKVDFSIFRNKQKT